MSIVKWKNKTIKIPPLSDVTAYLKNHPLLLLQEKNNYTAEKIMMLLDNEKLAALEDEFNEHPNGIELANFIWLMKSAINHPPEDKYELVNGLVKLFDEIDINGDGNMEWSEFTQYIIDAVIGEKDTKFFDARFEKDREFTENEILDKAYSRKTKRYVQSKQFDNSMHSNVIKKLVYSQGLDQIMVLELGSKKIKYYTPDYLVKNNLIPPFEEKGERAFILDFAFSEPLNWIALLTSDRYFYFFENFNHRLMKSFQTDVLQIGIWYLPIHQCWVTAGADHNIRTWSYDLHETAKPKMVLMAHMKQITEIIEINVPKLIASCSHDGFIKLWDLSEGTLQIPLKDPSGSSRGIRGMTYSYEYGGNLLTFGFENYINVWCPEVSLSRAYVSKLEGHSCIVVACKFIPGSPNCISIDDKTNIRIWDIRTLSTIQVLTSEQGAAVVNDIAIMVKHDKFVLGGKRLNIYDNSAVTKNIRNFNEDIYAIAVEYNSYYNFFVILTKIDIRIYDALTGKLKKVFNDLHDEKVVVDLTTFCFGGKQRKFYTADNAGFIRVYNMKNGEFIKKVNENTEIEGPEFEAKKQFIKKKDVNEVSQMIYLSDEKLLITSNWDSTIRIYDESEPEESSLLRIMSGGHKDSEILCLAYSGHFSLIASGSSNGFISLWDFESGKFEAFFKGHKSDINVLEFAEPYPLLISGSGDGSICVWGLKSLNSKYKYKCIIRILNTALVKGEEVPAAITSLVTQTDEIRGIRRDPYLSKYYNPQIHSGDGVYTEKVSSLKKKTKSKNKEDTGTENGGEGSRVLTIQEGSSDEVRETSKEFQKDEIDYENEQSDSKRRCYVYFGDNKGYMSLINLSFILKRREIGPIDKARKIASFQLRRKDIIIANKQVESAASDEKRQGKKPFSIHCYKTVLLQRWEAHSQPITKITQVKDPLSYVTCSSDRHVKFWSKEGSLLGDINLVKLGNSNQLWQYPFDWVKTKLEELEFVFKALKLIEKESLKTSDKELIKTKYLLSKYFPDNFNFAELAQEANAVGKENDQIEEPGQKSETSSISEKHTFNKKNIKSKTFVTSTKAGSLLKEGSSKTAGGQGDHGKGETGKGASNNYLDIPKLLSKLYPPPEESMVPSQMEKVEKALVLKSETKNYLDQRVFDEYAKGKIQEEDLLIKLKGQFEEKEKGRERDALNSLSVQSNLKDSKKVMVRTKINEDMFKKLNVTSSSNQRIVADSRNLAPIKKSNVLSSVTSTKTDASQYSIPNLKSKDVKRLPINAGISQLEDIREENKAEGHRAKTASSEYKARSLITGLSVDNLVRNSNFIQNIIKSSVAGSSRPQSEAFDMRYREGESSRALKMATVSQIHKFEAESPNILCKNNDILRKKQKFYKELTTSGKSLVPAGVDVGVEKEPEKKSPGKDSGQYQIIAKRAFLENPMNNSHKSLRCKKKIFVLN